jgi:hypothetical protein
MVRLQAVIAGTGVIPMYGQSLLDEDDLERMAEQLRGATMPMLTEHDLDKPIESVVAVAEVRDGPDGERQLYVEFDVPDDKAAEFVERQGMSIAFTRVTIEPKGGWPNAFLWVDPLHHNRFELAAAVYRLDEAGFRPAAGLYMQLALEPPPTVVFEIAAIVISQIGWNIAASAIYDGLKILLHRRHKTRFRFVIHKDADRITAEIETSSERGLRSALKALRDLDKENGGLFIREADRWREAGTGKRKRRGARRKPS